MGGESSENDRESIRDHSTAIRTLRVSVGVDWRLALNNLLQQTGEADILTTDGQFGPLHSTKWWAVVLSQW